MPIIEDLSTIKNKNVIIADVDETICETCQLISPEMAAKINSLISQGHIFAFISGTKREYLKNMISSKLQEKHHLLATTGAHYIEIHGDSEREIYRDMVEESERLKIISALVKLVDEYKIISLTTKEDQIQDRGTQITLSAIGRNAPLEAKKAHDPDGAKRTMWVKYLKQYLDENKYEINIAGTTSIDITPKGLDKEHGIRKFAAHHNLNFDEILFFGDKLDYGGNDFPATKVVDCVRVSNPIETLAKLNQIFD
ncbi:HAD-IIB family hydrolase [Candidatus Woesearchaeota archaeon]|nr:HAD-IIB family hydrolase [Candidatus Woesearchaeota archaeon]